MGIAASCLKDPSPPTTNTSVTDASTTTATKPTTEQKEITMTDINAILPGVVLTKADGQAYKDASHRWCENAEKEAKYIVQPKSAEDVSKAVRLPLSSSGHSVRSHLFFSPLVDQVRYRERPRSRHQGRRTFLLWSFFFRGRPSDRPCGAPEYCRR
jgi:hypothetical protein